MISIFDNLTAVMIFGVVLLILVAVQSRSLEMNNELLSTYSGKVASLDLAMLLENDLDNLGRDLAPDTVLMIAPTQDGAITRDFVFNLALEQTSSPGDMMSVQRRYRLIDDSIITVDTSNVQTYQLIREERIDSTGIFSAWTEKWASTQMLTYFNITMKDDQFLNTINADSAKYVRVAFAVLPAYHQDSQFIKEMSWNTTINVRPY
ncbi:MAG: hypothetical protein KTR29_00025 [Rhodothermaceae bacterium]|nr:hypothetical protein [Rhodothermaceae bacterium]